MKVVTAVLVCGAMVSVVAWVVALCHENRVCPFKAAVRFVRGLPLGGRLAVLPLFAALVVYGSVKNHSNEIGSESGFSRVDEGESGFNAEKAEAQEAQRGEGGDFGRVDRVEHVEESGSIRSYRSPLSSVINPMSAKIGEVSYVFDLVEEIP